MVIVGDIQPLRFSASGIPWVGAVIFRFEGIQLLGYWDVQSGGFSASAIFNFWDFQPLGYSVRWSRDIQLVGNSASGIFNLWDVRLLRCSESGIFSLCDIQLQGHRDLVL